MTKDKSFETERSRAVELMEDFVRAGLDKVAKLEPGIELIEPIEVLLTNGRCAGLRQLRACGDNGVAEGADIELAVSWAVSPGRNIMKGLLSPALPPEVVVPDGADAVDLESDLPFTSQCLAIPGGGPVDLLSGHARIPGSDLIRLEFVRR